MHYIRVCPGSMRESVPRSTWQTQKGWQGRAGGSAVVWFTPGNTSLMCIRFLCYHFMSINTVTDGLACSINRSPTSQNSQCPSNSAVASENQNWRVLEMLPWCSGAFRVRKGEKTLNYCTEPEHTSLWKSITQSVLMTPTFRLETENIQPKKFWKGSNTAPHQLVHSGLFIYLSNLNALYAFKLWLEKLLRIISPLFIKAFFYWRALLCNHI